MRRIVLILFVLSGVQVVLCQIDPSTAIDCHSGPSNWYRGTHNKTKDGIPCQRWDVNTPHNIKTKPKNDFHHNYCRNPDHDLTGLWCYTTDNDTRWQLCGIPKCPDDSLLLYTRRDLQGSSWISHFPADPEVGFIRRDTHRTVYNASTSSFIWTIESDKRGKRVFFIDSRNNRLGILSMATNKTSFFMKGMCNGMEELAYDWAGKNLYWTDSDKHWVMASDLTFTNFMKIYKNESEEPLGITLHALKRKLYFFTSGYLSSSFIKTCNMDGSNVTSLFSFPSSVDVPSMTVDYTDDRLYWIRNNSPQTAILSCNSDGGNLTTIYSRRVGRHWGIAAYMDTIYLADQIGYYDTIRGRFYRLWILSKKGIPRNSYKSPYKTKSVSIYSTNEEYSPTESATLTICAATNLCDQLCIPMSATKYTCGCSPGYKTSDNKCVSDLYEDNFIIIGDLTQKKIFQIPLDDEPDNYRVLNISTSFDETITTIAFDPTRKFLYWSDLSTTTIYQSGLDGANVKSILTGKHAKSIAVDPATGNVYFADDDSSYIYVVDRNGFYPKVLHKPTDAAVENNYIEDLTLDFDNKYVYWTAREISDGNDLNSIGVVMRMGFDGSDQRVVLHNIITPRAIYVDNERRTLFLTTNGNNVYEMLLRELVNPSGNLPRNKQRYFVNTFSREDPLVKLIVLGGHGYAIGSSGNKIIKFDLTRNTHEYSFGSNDFFRPRFLVAYNATQQQRFANQAIECNTMNCKQLCLQRPDHPPVCQCGDAFKVSSSPNKCIPISADDYPPSYGKTCPQDIELSYMFCKPAIPLPPWEPPTWTDDITESSKLKLTFPTIENTYRSGTYNFIYTATDEAENTGYCSFTVTISRTLCKLVTPSISERRFTISPPKCDNGDIIHGIRCRDTTKWVRYGNWLNKTSWNLCLPSLRWMITNYSQLNCEAKPTIRPSVTSPVILTTEKLETPSDVTMETKVDRFTGTPKRFTGTPERREMDNYMPDGRQDSMGSKTKLDSMGNKTKLGSYSKPVAATSGLSGGIIAAIIVIVLVVIIAAAILVFILRKKSVPGVSMNPFSLKWNKSSDFGLSPQSDQTYHNF